MPAGDGSRQTAEARAPSRGVRGARARHPPSGRAVHWPGQLIWAHATVLCWAVLQGAVSWGRQLWARVALNGPVGQSQIPLSAIRLSSKTATTSNLPPRAVT